MSRRAPPFHGKLDRPVVLVGLMGAGKSTVGRRLARRLGLPFVDSDSEIEDAAGLSAGEVFRRFGERDFRDGERRVVARLAGGPVRVIATGGGAFVNEETRSLLNQRCITVWLDAPVGLLTERTARRPETRPMLNDGDRSATLSRLDEERRPAYAEAHIRVPSEGGSHSQVVEKIIAAIGRHLEEQA
ncbi:shikimate kinase [Sphingomonas swuensis]|uniref:Shikimate kinase n=1 Tax=Sphingomonas swuensis TaxID=977800 RepID=A0ABP7T130_9SPHN